MKTLFLFLFALEVAAAGHAAFAQTSRPSTDQGRLQQMITSGTAQLATASYTGDVEVVRTFLWAENDPKRVLADAAAHKIVADIAFHVHAARLLGEPGTRKLEDIFDVRALDGMQLMSVDWNIDGDKARPIDQPEFSVTLRNVNQIWRLDVTPDPAPASVEAAAAEVRAKSEAVAKVTQAINDRKLVTADQIKAALAQAGLKRP
jgi:hypothetical protein